LKQTPDGYTARFERHLKHSVEKVWQVLTDNAQLAKWFSELRVDDLRVGGRIKFDMHDGTFMNMEILALETNAALEYTWGEDRVRFELNPEPGGCRLLLIEQIAKLTDHSSKDLAGWHVCLDVIRAVLDDEAFEAREQEWQIQHERYVRLVAELRV
jgi:uncharacterized protein YndB with AHSA1/START domain